MKNFLLGFKGQSVTMVVLKRVLTVASCFQKFPQNDVWQQYSKTRGPGGLISFPSKKRDGWCLMSLWKENSPKRCRFRRKIRLSLYFIRSTPTTLVSASLSRLFNRFVVKHWGCISTNYVRIDDAKSLKDDVLQLVHRRAWRNLIIYLFNFVNF